MPTLPYVPADVTEPRDVVDAIRARRGGRLLNLDRMLLHSPPVAAGWNALLGAVRGRTALPARPKELEICAVAVLNGAEYEWNHHAPLLAAAGAPAEQLAALRDPDGRWADPSVFDAAERAVLALARAMTRDVAVPPALLAALRAALPDDRQTFELVTTVAAYNMVSRVLVALGVEDEPRAGGVSATQGGAAPPPTGDQASR